jgi:predicted enzyme related to lactoylglutathione lyase
MPGGEKQGRCHAAAGGCRFAAISPVYNGDGAAAGHSRHDELTLAPPPPEEKGEGEMANAFVHVELNTTDVGKAKEFYGKLFKWTLEDVPMDGDASYTLIKPGEGTGGGMMQQMIPGAPSSWLAYVDVDDIEAATKQAKSLGAKVMKDVTEVMDAGWLSIIVDPTGAVLGLWKAKPRQAAG